MGRLRSQSQFRQFRLIYLRLGQPRAVHGLSCHTTRIRIRIRIHIRCRKLKPVVTAAQRRYLYL